MSKKLLILSTDSEHYTDLYTDVCDAADETVEEEKAIDILLDKESMQRELTDVFVERRGSSFNINLTFDDGYFVVAKAVPMPKQAYAVVWWRAYGRVSFGIKGKTDSEETAIKILDKYVGRHLKEKNGFDLYDYAKGDRFVLADDECSGEFQMLKVLKLKEDVR